MTIREGYEMMFLEELKLGLIENRFRLVDKNGIKIFTLNFEKGNIRYQENDNKMVCISKNNFKLFLNPTYQLRKLFKKDNNE